jgi:septal ring factor EnvC (AmiA/AmiB activator)
MFGLSKEKVQSLIESHLEGFKGETNQRFKDLEDKMDLMQKEINESKEQHGKTNTQIESIQKSGESYRKQIEKARNDLDRIDALVCKLSGLDLQFQELKSSQQVNRVESLKRMLDEVQQAMSPVAIEVHRAVEQSERITRTLCDLIRDHVHQALQDNQENASRIERLQSKVEATLGSVTGAHFTTGK